MIHLGTGSGPIEGIQLPKILVFRLCLGGGTLYTHYSECRDAWGAILVKEPIL